METVLQRVESQKYSPDGDYTHVLIEMIARGGTPFFTGQNVRHFGVKYAYTLYPFRGISACVMGGFKTITPRC